MNWKECGEGLMKGPSRHLSGGTEKIVKELCWGWSVPRSRF